MNNQVFTQITFVAAYVAGAVALFAPCCISYLLPAYLGNIFKERSRILLMTLIYSLGIFVVMLPIVLGAKALSDLFFDLHDTTYIFGGVLMLFVSLLTFFGIKLPMPHFVMKGDGSKPDIVSTFTLGVFSGVTSACCAPVLIGVLALSSLTPNLLQSVLVGAFYVLGMVTPLYFASIFIHKKNLLARPILKRRITTIRFGVREFPVFVSNIVGFLIFFVTGILMLYLTSIGKLGMSETEENAAKSIYAAAEKVSSLSNIAILNIVFMIAAVLGLYWYINRAKKEVKDKCCEDGGEKL